MLSSLQTSAGFEQVIADTLMELAEIPTRRQRRDTVALLTLTTDSADAVTVFEPMSRTLRSHEAGQR